LKLIGFFTNIFFFQRLDTSLVSPESHHLGPFVIAQQFFQLTASERKTLLVAGAAAGIVSNVCGDPLGAGARILDAEHRPNASSARASACR
jgi:hypothetical protein